ncbi:ankyrin repeat-containing domain protein [Lanmaoa asiatica]|nr:ankyrin repeat-containing domain protein [Lanmaoa asiatica]
MVQNIATRNKEVDLDATKSELLRWLDGFDCTDKHENTCGQRQETTGEWLFKEQLYVDRRKSSTKFFWLHGKAGAGKSVLASFVIDNLFSGLTSDETFAYFYCDFRNPRCTTAMEVFRSLIKQLLFRSKLDWLSSFPDLMTRKQQGAGPPTSLGTLSDLLQRAVKLHGRPIIVIDALDECDDLSNLLDELIKLSHGHCYLFVTSRSLHAITQAFTGLPSISLNDRVAVMRSDMHFHVKTELESRSRLKILRQDLKDEIQGVLMKKADGMFRWVQCQLDRLDNCYSLGDIREVLDTLPETLFETYDQMLRAIDKKPFGSHIARRALAWLVTALRPLNLSELAKALAIRNDKPDWEPARAPMHENDILEILGSLVALGEKWDHNPVALQCQGVPWSTETSWSLTQHLWQEYLTSNTIAHNTFFVHLPSASLEIVTVSIFSLILFGDKSKLAVDNWRFNLPVYAVDYALLHLADCHSDHNESLVWLLLALQDHISTHRQIYIRLEWFHRWMATVPRLALYIIVRFGHLSMLCHYLGRHPIQVTQADNPLIFAALYGDVPRVQLLLDEGLDVNLEGPVYKGSGVHKMSPLTAAARNEMPEHQEGLVKLLLANGSIVPRDAIHTILLCNFGTPCKPAVARILLEHGADPQYLVIGKRSCLHLVLEARGVPPDDRLEIARMLYTAGCDPMAVDERGLSSLDLAIQSLSREFVQWFIQCGFQLPPDAILYTAPGFFRTHIDVEKFLSLLEFLAANGALTSTQDAHGCNALHFVSSYIYVLDDTSVERVIRMLVKHGCDINCQNDAGETPLQIAMSSRLSLRALEAFLKQGAEMPEEIHRFRYSRI